MRRPLHHNVGMWGRKRAPRTPESVNISGVHSSAVVVGSGNTTVQGSAIVAGSLDKALENLRAQIEAHAGDQVQAALEQAGVLERAAKSSPPDLTAIARVRGWFVRNLPVIVPALAGVVQDPTVAAAIKAAAEIAAGSADGPGGG